MNKQYLIGEIATRDNSDFFHRLRDALPNPDKILRRTGKTIEAYRELKNDPHLWSCVQSRKSGTLSLENTIAASGASERVAKEVESMIKDLDLQRTIRDILEAPLFGYQPMEIVWKLTGGRRKYYVPDRIVGKPQEWFFFDKDGGLRYRKGGGLDGETPPPMKIICPRYEASYLNPYGDALLSKCYWPVTFKNGGLRFWVNFAERFGMPFLIGQYGRGATQEEIQSLATKLAEMTEDSVIVTPSDIDVDMRESGKSSSVELFRELIKYCNAEISKAVLSQTLTTEIDMGSYAAANAHFKIRKEVVSSDVRLVEAAINEVIKYIVDLNFGGASYPKFKILMNDSENMEKVDRDLKLSKTGAFRFTKKYWMNSYGFKEEEIE